MKLYFNEKKIAIIGAGIAGLTFGNLIKKYLKHDFMIYEKEENLSLEEVMEFNWPQIVQRF